MLKVHPVWPPVLPHPDLVSQAPVTPEDGLCLLKPSGQQFTHLGNGVDPKK